MRDGDTLYSIAQAVWGDAAMWYLIAEANGLNGSEHLAAGTTLVIPNKVTNIHNNADTYRVYDPNKAMGETSPTDQPKPPKAKGPACGTMGLIIISVIAVAVTLATAGAAVAALTPAAGAFSGLGLLAGGATGLSAGTLIGIGAASAALGSAVSQGIGVATGMQHKFSWKAVGLAAVSGAVSAGLGATSIFKSIPTAFLQGAVRQATANAITQGVGVATKLQKKFDWTGVAVAGVVGGATAVLGKVIPGAAQYDQATNELLKGASFGHLVAVGGLSSMAGAATRSVITGTSFGDNILAVGEAGARSLVCPKTTTSAYEGPASAMLAAISAPHR